MNSTSALLRCAHSARCLAVELPNPASENAFRTADCTRRSDERTAAARAPCHWLTCVTTPVMLSATAFGSYSITLWPALGITVLEVDKASASRVFA